MGSKPGKKAELDKDGISPSLGKAQLDKEGVDLDRDMKAEPSPEADPLESAEAAGEQAKPPRRRAVVIASVVSCAAFLFIIAAGAAAYLATREEPAKAPMAAQAKPAPVPGLDSPGGEIALDPFMVLYTPASPKESGVLLAQLTLRVSPEIAYTIGSSMTPIRGLIYQRLAAGVEVYSKAELLSMLRDDLKGFNVRDVVFSQFEKR